MSLTRVSLTGAQQQRLAAAADRPQALFAEIAAVAAEALGCALFTAMHFDAAAGEVERLYSTDPRAYPIGGRKTKRDTPWAAHVLAERRVFVGAGDAAIRAAFDDHEKIRALGLHSIINVPITAAGTCVGTVNFLMRGETLTAEDVAVAEALGQAAAAAFRPLTPQGDP